MKGDDHGRIITEGELHKYAVAIKAKDARIAALEAAGEGLYTLVAIYLPLECEALAAWEKVRKP